MTEENGDGEISHIRYSAKELLAIQNGALAKLQDDVTRLRLEIKDISLASVTRQELTTTRRWAVGAAVSGTAALAALLRLLGV